MGKNAIVGDARASIYTKLNHEVSVLKKSLTKINIVFSFCGRLSGQVKENEEPTHFIIQIFHGS